MPQKLKEDSFTLHNQFYNRQQELEFEKISLQKKIDKAPPGKLIISTKKDGHYNWYVSNGSTKSYIPKKNRQLAVDLASKKYNEAQLKTIKSELLAIKSYNYHFDPDNSATLKILQNPAYTELLNLEYKSSSYIIDDWLEEEYQTNPFHKDELTNIGAGGKRFRSKSEVIIDMLLTTKGIPHKYECMLIANGREYYPDFTIMHPITHKIYYWEHCGMMDNEDYFRHWQSKLYDYQREGIIEDINLICTMETIDMPLSSEYVEKKINMFFG